MQIAGLDITQVVQVVITLAVTYIIARMVARTLFKIFEKTPFPESIEKGILRISKYVVYIVGVFVVISLLGVDLTSVILALGAFSIAISFAVRDITQNFVSGILVQTDRAFKVGDEIKVQAFEGRVVKLSIRTTIIETKEGDTVSIPNSIFIKNPVIKKKLTSDNV